jgi:hypothetical protein
MKAAKDIIIKTALAAAAGQNQLGSSSSQAYQEWDSGILPVRRPINSLPAKKTNVMRAVQCTEKTLA